MYDDIGVNGKHSVNLGFDLFVYQLCKVLKCNHYSCSYRSCMFYSISFSFPAT